MIKLYFSLIKLNFAGAGPFQPASGSSRSNWLCNSGSLVRVTNRYFHNTGEPVLRRHGLHQPGERGGFWRAAAGHTAPPHPRNAEDSGQTRCAGIKKTVAILEGPARWIQPAVSSLLNILLQSCGSPAGSVTDPDAGAFWIRIWIRNPYTDSGSCKRLKMLNHDKILSISIFF